MRTERKLRKRVEKLAMLEAKLQALTFAKDRHLQKLVRRNVLVQKYFRVKYRYEHAIIKYRQRTHQILSSDNVSIIRRYIIPKVEYDTGVVCIVLVSIKRGKFTASHSVIPTYDFEKETLKPCKEWIKSVQNNYAS